MALVRDASKKRNSVLIPNLLISDAMALEPLPMPPCSKERRNGVIGQHCPHVSMLFWPKGGIGDVELENQLSEHD